MRWCRVSTRPTKHSTGSGRSWCSGSAAGVEESGRARIGGFEKRRLVLRGDVVEVRQLDAEGAALGGGIEGGHDRAQVADHGVRRVLDRALVVQVAEFSLVHARALEVHLRVVGVLAVAHIEDVLLEDHLLAARAGLGVRDVKGDGFGVLGFDRGEDALLQHRDDAASGGGLRLELFHLRAPEARAVLEVLRVEQTAVECDAVHGQADATRWEAEVSLASRSVRPGESRMDRRSVARGPDGERRAARGEKNTAVSERVLKVGNGGAGGGMRRTPASCARRTCFSSR